MKFSSVIVAISIASLLAASCSKYKEIGNSDFYPDQKLYLPAAAEGASLNGIYNINAVAAPGRTFRYLADVPNKKLNIPLSVYRSGINNKGSLSADIIVNTDTVTKLLAGGRLPAGVQLLPTARYTIGTTVVVNDGSENADFTLAADLNFLLANLTTKYVLAVGVAASGKAPVPGSTAIILIDPAFLVPTAAFTTTISTRTVNFSNTSLNAAMYSWDYGDGTALSTERATSHIYTAAGTYTIKLTTSGALGDFNRAVYSSTVVVN